MDHSGQAEPLSTTDDVYRSAAVAVALLVPEFIKFNESTTRKLQDLVKVSNCKLFLLILISH